MKVQECMSRDVEIVTSNDTVQRAAAIMAKTDTGAVPVGENDRLVGMITDRDIAIRVIANGRGAERPVREVMTSEVKYCFEDEDVEQVAENMAGQQLRRLPVLNRDKRLVGIISLADLAKSAGDGCVSRTMSGITRPGGQHTHSARA